jgi:ribosome-binding protein aMBF1 (putative translation factor)
MKLIDNTPIGTRRSMVHVNYGPKRGCEWKEVDQPQYSDEDLFRGRRFRDARMQAAVSIFEMSKRLGIGNSAISAIELGWKRPADEAEEAKFFDALKIGAGLKARE